MKLFDTYVQQAAALLRPALESALNHQGETDYQILIVDDDGMEENESALSPAEELVRQLNDPRIVYYRNRHNLGLMDNWNTCLLYTSPSPRD